MLLLLPPLAVAVESDVSSNSSVIMCFCAAYFIFPSMLETIFEFPVAVE